ncbi:MAG: hypothetical protein R3D55_07990 [Chloroflexota bacterium]
MNSRIAQLGPHLQTAHGNHASYFVSETISPSVLSAFTVTLSPTSSANRLLVG